MLAIQQVSTAPLAPCQHFSQVLDGGKHLWRGSCRGERFTIEHEQQTDTKKLKC
jgi:hypothetical protein